MNFQDILQQIQERLKSLWEQIQESSIYQQAIEKYEDQSPQIQKGIQIGGAILFALLVLMIPLGNLFSSFSHVDEFEQKRELTRELLRTSRDASQTPNIPQAPDPQVLETQIKNELQGLNLIPEQIKSVQQSPSNSKLIPNEFSIGSIEVQLQNLNTRQIVDVAYQLSKLHPSVKFTDLSMEASLDHPGYFHLIGKVIALKAPQIIMPPDEPERPNGKGGNKKDGKKDKSRKGDDDENVKEKDSDKE